MDIHSMWKCYCGQVNFFLAEYLDCEEEAKIQPINCLECGKHFDDVSDDELNNFPTEEEALAFIEANKGIVVQALVGHDWENLDTFWPSEKGDYSDDFVRLVLKHGFKGYDQFSDKELLESLQGYA